jgi:hypothetical protein
MSSLRYLAKKYGGITFLAGIFLGGVIVLHQKSEDWTGKGISIAYALFSSASFIIIAACVIAVCCMLSDGIFKTGIFHFRAGRLDHSPTTAQRIMRFLGPVIVFVALFGIFWIIKDVPVYTDPYENDAWPLPPALR